MTIRELMASGVKFVKKRAWESGNYMELPPTTNGFHGPWAKLGVHGPDGVIPPAEYGLETPVLLHQYDDGEGDWEAIELPLRRAEEIGAR